LEQFVKRGGREGCELDEHVLGTAQADVGARNVCEFSFKGYAAVHRVEAMETERIYFFAEQFFQAKQASGNKLQFHKYSLWWAQKDAHPVFYLL
jgi:hypothetical protein